MFFIFSCVCSKELTFKPHHYGSTSGAYTRSAHCNIMKTAWDFSLSMKLSMKMTHTIATALSHVKWSLEFEKKKVKWESHKSNGKTLITSCIDKRFALVLIRHQPRQYMHQGFRKHRGLARKCVQICSAISLMLYTNSRMLFSPYPYYTVFFVYISDRGYALTSSHLRSGFPRWTHKPDGKISDPDPKIRSQRLAVFVQRPLSDRERNKQTVLIVTLLKVMLCWNYNMGEGSHTKTFFHPCLTKATS